LLTPIGYPFQFEALMESTEPGEGDLYSKGVSSELASRAVWKLRIYPNGDVEQSRGKITAFLYLTGPMVGRSGCAFER
jgi:hypothetical protein